MSLITSKIERIRFLKFALVGLSGTIVDFGTMNFFRLVLNLPLVWSQGISFVLAVLNNFFWNRRWTYPETKNQSAKKQLIQFFIINIIGIAIRTPIVTNLNKLFLSLLEKQNWNFKLGPQFISQNLALAISISIVILWNYFANRYWTFKDIPSGQTGKQAEVGDTDK